MPKQNSISPSELKLAKIISRLENELISGSPNGFTAKKLMTVLDRQSPNTNGNGNYSECQRALAARFQNSELTSDDLTRDRITEIVKEWWYITNKYKIEKSVVVTQVIEGKKIKINEIYTQCGDYIDFFEKNNAIKKICFSCYKIQLIAIDVISLIHLYLFLKKIKLRRNNTRKCMVEIREEFPYPYKGYIYCESENEANDILTKIQYEILKSGLRNVYCAISHGCSEYGLAFPEFKYSKDGAHRSFEQPDKWRQLEMASEATPSMSKMIRLDYSSSEVTLRDVACFQTWLAYAEIIGDPTYQYFTDIPPNKKPRQFTDLVKKQAGTRNAQLIELQQRQNTE